jgi:hypothetical protein
MASAGASVGHSGDGDVEISVQLEALLSVEPFQSGPTRPVGLDQEHVLGAIGNRANVSDKDDVTTGLDLGPERVNGAIQVCLVKTAKPSSRNRVSMRTPDRSAISATPTARASAASNFSPPERELAFRLAPA